MFVGDGPLFYFGWQKRVAESESGRDEGDGQRRVDFRVVAIGQSLLQQMQKKLKWHHTMTCTNLRLFPVRARTFS